MSYKILEKVAVVLAVLIFNCKPVASIRATPLAVMNSTKMWSYPRHRGPVPPSKPDPRTDHFSAPPNPSFHG